MIFTKDYCICNAKTLFIAILRWTTFLLKMEKLKSLILDWLPSQSKFICYLGKILQMSGLDRRFIWLHKHSWKTCMVQKQMFGHLAYFCTNSFMDTIHLNIAGTIRNLRNKLQYLLTIAKSRMKYLMMQEN